jgi:hypothetical protein
MMKSVCKVANLFVGAAIACSAQQLHAQTQSEVNLVAQQSLERASPEIISNQSTRGPQLSRDKNGRLTQITFANGDFVHYRFDGKGQRILDKTSFDGVERDREATLSYLGLHDPHWIPSRAGLANQAATKSANGEGCQGSLVCLGVIDDINKFVENLANWLGVGAATGGTIGGVNAVVAGAEGVAILEGVGLGAFVGGAVVVAFAGGYIIGTGINAAGEAVYYWVAGDGKLTMIPHAVFSSTYSGD